MKPTTEPVRAPTVAAVAEMVMRLSQRPLADYGATRSGRWRSLMSEACLRRRGYGRRWAVERFFSGLKRPMGAALNARRPDQMLAYALRRLDT